MNFFDIMPLVQNIGLLGIFLFVFAESGLFFGFFLPGDSLLFTAGILASAAYFDLPVLLIGCFLSAVLGDSLGYWFGQRVGPGIFSRPDSFFWSKQNLEKTSLFFERHGNKTIVLARFVPIVRTFAPILAGAARMRYSTFLFWNIFGGLFWAVGLILAGYFLGSLVPGVDRYILPIIALIVILSLLPILKVFKKANSRGEKNIV